jgi:hypothetical protein
MGFMVGCFPDGASRTHERVDAMRYALLVLIAVVLGSFSSIASAESDLSRLKQQTLSELGPFRPEARLSFHHAMNELFMRLWDQKKRKVLWVGTPSAMSDYEFLHLSDKDGDGVAEEFAYSHEKKAFSSPDFGFFFDLNGDKRADYLIFFGGSLMAEGKGPDDLAIWWMNYHAIDANGDGKVDNVLFQGSSDLNGNGKVEPEIGLWLVDDDYDGTLDRAFYLGPGVEKAVRLKKKGSLDLSHNLILNDKTVRIGDAIGDFWDELLSDINAGIARMAK